jgi:hypothetical protein
MADGLSFQASVCRQGRAYVISGRDGNVLFTLDSSNGQEDGHFGRSVAGIPDINGDNVPDVAVGARGEYNNPEWAGYRAADEWTWIVPQADLESAKAR